MVVCGGSFDLFHLCRGKQPVTPNLFCKSSEFFHLPLLAFMIENGADINSETKNHWTSLHYAAGNGHLGVVDYLVNQKAEINAKDENDQTPLHYAADKDHLSVVEYLVNQKSDINAIDKIVEFFYI